MTTAMTQERKDEAGKELGDKCLAEMATICATQGNLVGIQTLDALRNCVLSHQSAPTPAGEAEKLAAILEIIDRGGNYSHAMEVATTSFSTTKWSLIKQMERDREKPDAERVMRSAIRAAIYRYVEEAWPQIVDAILRRAQHPQPTEHRTCATCHAVLADGPQPAACYAAQPADRKEREANPPGEYPPAQSRQETSGLHNDSPRSVTGGGALSQPTGDVEGLVERAESATAYNAGEILSVESSVMGPVEKAAVAKSSATVRSLVNALVKRIANLRRYAITADSRLATPADGGQLDWNAGYRDGMEAAAKISAEKYEKLRYEAAVAERTEVTRSLFGKAMGCKIASEAIRTALSTGAGEK